MTEGSATGDSWVPDDPLAFVRPGDPDPFLGRIGTCSVRWWDECEDPEDEAPWQCHRDTHHLGQHIATDPGSHVAAVYSEVGP